MMTIHQTGPKNGMWRGGKSLASNGYILIRVGNDHPLADVRGYAYEHRLVAQEKAVPAQIQALKDRMETAEARVKELEGERGGWEAAAKVAREGGAREERDRCIEKVISIACTWPTPNEDFVLQSPDAMRALLSAALEPKP
jgi:hypothetical protein